MSASDSIASWRSFSVTSPVTWGTEDLPARGEVELAHILVEHSLVRAEVHIAFHAVIEDEHLTVPERVQRAGVDVEVAFELDRRDLKAFVLHQLGQAG
jgi:hypothetical protein